MSSQPIHVLCVDDDVHVLSFVGATLREAGCDVETALDGAHALQLIATSHRDFDVMIVDVRMPNLDGWRFIVAARGAGYRGKVIVFSAFFDADERKRFRELKIDAAIEKPPKSGELLQVVRRVVLSSDTPAVTS
jgi:DNA-binding response OmpR family regulator